MTATPSNRTRAERFKQLMNLYLRSVGTPTHPAPYLLSRSQRADAPLGSIWGLPDGVVIRTHAERGVLPGEQVSEVRKLAGNDRLAFVVQHRWGATDAADALVFTDARTLAAILRRLQRLEELETEAAA